MREDDRMDESMDALLRDTLTAPAPQLSRGFDANVMKRVRPRRLNGSGRVAMWTYAAAALIVGGWLLRDVPVEWIAASVALSIPAAAGLAAYARSMNPA